MSISVPIYEVERIASPSVPSPLKLSCPCGEGTPVFVADTTRVLIHAEIGPDAPPRCDETFEKAGPRAEIAFEPAKVRAAIVTCVGLCPGLNNVIRSAFFELTHNYGVPVVLGIRYGYSGMDLGSSSPPLQLTEQLVDAIQNDGGTILGSSRGPVAPEKMVDFLVHYQIDILITVGGDGTTKGAMALVEEIRRRGLKIAVVSVPKTIDNDIPFVNPSFGYSTAIARARDVLESAHAEAKGAPYGIGLVKLMGREAGFIAAGATLASQQVNFCLIPEQKLVLHGPRGFLELLCQRMLTRQHAVIALAEGAGQELFPDSPVAYDASGNKKLHDIGSLLRNEIPK